MYISPDSNELSFGLATTANFNEGLIAETQYALNEWTHIGFVKRGLNIEAYINGQLDSTEALSAPNKPNTGAVRLGAGPGDGAPTNASYDNFRAYARALTATEMQTLAAGDDGGGGGGGGDEIHLVNLPMDEGQGSTTADQSGNNHNGTLSSGVTWVAGFSGQGIQTNGVNGELRIPHRPALDLGGSVSDFTIGFRARIEAGPTGEWRALAKKGDSWDERAFAIYLAPDTNEITFAASTENNFNEGGFANSEFVVGEWKHYTYVRRGPTIELYLDGQLDATETLSGSLQSNFGAIRFGDGPNDGAPTQATFDDLQIFARAFDAAEVGQLSAGLPVGALANASDPGKSAAAGVATSLTTTARSVSGSFALEINFGSDVSGLSVGDFTVTNASISGLSSLSASSYFATVAPENEGVISIILPAGSATAADGASNLESNELSVSYLAEAIPPAAPEQQLLTLSTESRRKVTFKKTFSKPVVFTTVEKPESAPHVVVQLSNITSAGYELEIQRVDGVDEKIDGIQVHALVLEEGVYQSERDGIQMEIGVVDAPIHDRNHEGDFLFTTTRKNLSYHKPIVIGQIQTSESNSLSVPIQGIKQGEVLELGVRALTEIVENNARARIGYAVIELGNWRHINMSFISTEKAKNEPPKILSHNEFALTAISSIESAELTFIQRDEDDERVIQAIDAARLTPTDYNGALVLIRPGISDQ
ncbi:MAG: LamG domain-containing protein [Verrucomicrobiota bacterium]